MLFIFSTRVTSPDLALKSGAGFFFFFWVFSFFALNRKPRRRAARRLSGRHGWLAVAQRLPPGDYKAEPGDAEGGRGRGDAVPLSGYHPSPVLRGREDPPPQTPGSGARERTRSSPRHRGIFSGARPRGRGGEAFPCGVRRPGNVLFALNMK